MNRPRHGSIDFSANLRLLMRVRHVDGAQLARQLGSTPRNLSRLIRGQTQPRLGDVLALARALRVEPAELAFMRYEDLAAKLCPPYEPACAAMAAK